MRMNTGLLCVMPLLVALSALAASEVSIEATYVPAEEPLTTEKVWTLDPELTNPHHQRWVLERDVRIEGLEAVPLSNQRWTARAIVVRSAARSFVRPSGPWFHSLNEFPCQKGAKADDGRFATPDGSRKAAREAANLWAEILSGQKPKLNFQLERLVTDNPVLAKAKALMIFKDWLSDVTEKWRQGMFKVRLHEWDTYVEEAGAAGVCKTASTSTLREWMAMMEPLPTLPSHKLLTRAPARRWDGLYSIRLNIGVGERKLNGQFLIDTSASQSVISPSWLNSQGILPAWVEIPGAPFVRARGKLSRQAVVDSVEMSGYLLFSRDFSREFVFGDTDFFGPPETVASCCDGVLGMDFLRNVVLEIVPTSRAEIAEVKLWDRAGFRPEGYQWTEVVLSPDLIPMSTCRVQPEKKGAKAVSLNINWDTGMEQSLALPREHVSGGALWDVSCPGDISSRNVPAVSEGPEVNETHAKIGMGFLGRGPFILDFPHGRIWISREALSSGFLSNRSGLKFEYVFSKGDRVLKVLDIQPNSPADVLSRAGLKKGMFLTRIDSKPVEDIDASEVELRLSGVYGDTVSVEWNTRQGLKVAPIKVR